MVDLRWRRRQCVVVTATGPGDGSKVTHDSFTLTFESAVKLQDIERVIGEIRQHDVSAMRPAVDEAAIDGLKFSECLPVELAIEMLERRLQEPEATRRILKEHVRFLVQAKDVSK